MAQAQSYADFLKEQGATEEELKTLDTAPARKAYDKLMAQVAAAADTKRKADETIAANREWAQQVESQNQAYLKERDSAQIEAAAARARIAKMGELGLIEIAEKIEPGSTKPPAADVAAFDASKYVTNDTLLTVAEREEIGLQRLVKIFHRRGRLVQPLGDIRCVVDVQTRSATLGRGGTSGAGRGSGGRGVNELQE